MKKIYVLLGTTDGSTETIAASFNKEALEAPKKADEECDSHIIDETPFLDAVSTFDPKKYILDESFTDDLLDNIREHIIEQVLEHTGRELLRGDDAHASKIEKMKLAEQIRRLTDQVRSLEEAAKMEKRVYEKALATYRAVGEEICLFDGETTEEKAKNARKLYESVQHVSRFFGYKGEER